MMNTTREKRKENEGNRRPASGIYSTNHPRATKHLVGAPHFVTAFSPACCLSGLSGRLIGGRKSLRYQLIFITTFKHLDKLINLASANRPDLPNEMENERPGRRTVEADCIYYTRKEMDETTEDERCRNGLPMEIVWLIALVFKLRPFYAP